MKWARVHDKRPADSSKDSDAAQDKKNDAICFDEYPDIDTLKKDMEQPDNKWAHHSFKHHFRTPGSYELFQKRYETFCGGFLFFYDEIVRRRTVDHTIHFNWSPEKGTGKYSVTIYLSPAPQKAIRNYAKINGKSYDEYYREKTNKDIFQNLTTSGDGDGEDSLSVDPPPPPPPPPPSLY